MQLLDYFSELTVYPENAKKLRELVLQLAVQGKLTASWRESHPELVSGSNSAQVLLDKIKAVKAQLVQEGKIKKEKALPKIKDEEKPYELPEGWVWCRLGLVTNYGYCLKVEPKNTNQNTWVLELEDVEKSTSRLLKKVRFSERKFKSSKNTFEKGDVIYGKLRPYLDKVILADESGVCTTEMIPMKFYGNSNPSYLRLYLKNPDFIRFANDSTHGMNLPRMGTDKARSALFTLPPFEEQKAIVAKVDALMKEIDALEQLSEKRIEQKNKFVASALHHISTSDTQAMNGHWDLLKSNFRHTLDETDNVKKLRETILQLAVQGKLTSAFRASNPELVSGSHSATALLEKIKAEKAQLIQEGKIKKEKSLSAITDDEIPYELPEGWIWCRLGEVAQKLGAGSTPLGGKNAYVDDGIKFLRSQNIYNDGLRLNGVALIPDKTHAKMSGTHVQPQDLLLNITGGSIGRCALVPDSFDTANVSQHVAIVRMIDFNTRGFIHNLITGPQFQDSIMDVQVGVSREGLSMTKLKLFLVPLPPLAEQKAIVEKVNQLMSLCDQLDQHITDNRHHAEDLMKSLVREVFEERKEVKV